MPTEPKKTSTPTLISALRILASEVESNDGVANMTIAEGADRIEELCAELAALRRDKERLDWLMARDSEFDRPAIDAAMKGGRDE